MRSRTPRPAERSGSKPGPNDQAYLEYGSLSAAKSGQTGRRRPGGPRNAKAWPVWKRLAGGMALVAIPLGLLGLFALWSSAEETTLSPAELAQRRTADKKACHDLARVETASGAVRLDPRARERCLVDRGWKLDDRGEPTECIGSCRTR